MSARVITLESGLWLTIVLQIDTDFWTPEVTREFADFWADELDPDPLIATAKRLASHAVRRELDGFNQEFLLEFDEDDVEGWPTNLPGFPGAVVLDIECPSISPDAFEVTEDSGGAA
jgi:hypothetical protein